MIITPISDKQDYRNSRNPYRIVRRAGYQGACSAAVATPAQCTKNQLQGHQTKLLACNKATLISTFNVGTLVTINQDPEGVSSAIELNINAICIQEHRYLYSGVKINFRDIGKGCNFISVSAWKKSIDNTISGYGMLLSPLASKALISFEEIEARVIIENFNVNPVSSEAVTQFQESLSSLVRLVPKQNFLDYRWGYECSGRSQ